MRDLHKQAQTRKKEKKKEKKKNESEIKKNVEIKKRKKRTNDFEKEINFLFNHAIPSRSIRKGTILFHELLKVALATLFSSIAKTFSLNLVEITTTYERTRTNVGHFFTILNVA